jgi:hypothetical protein
MGQWITDLGKLLEPYEHPLIILAAIAAILGITVLGVLSTVLKPVRSFVSSLWSRMPWQGKNPAPTSRADLRFVALAHQPFIGDVQGSDGNRNVEIFSNGQ